MQHNYLLVLLLIAVLFSLGCNASSAPTATPSAAPTTPTATPTTATPTAVPTTVPTTVPTNPTAVPTILPTSPTTVPNVVPTSPTAFPTAVPTAMPSISPTAVPTTTPTAVPTTVSPSHIPTVVPTSRPTTEPSPDDPNLLAFTLDCSIGKMVLTFDELISARTMDMTGVGLQPVEDLDGTNYTSLKFTGSFNTLDTQGNTTDLVIYINADDFARIKLNPPVATSLGTSYLTLVRDSVFTPFNLANVEKTTRNALVAATFVPDRFPPYVESFSLDMNEGWLTITFTEPIHLPSFQLEGLTLQTRAYMGEEVNDPVLQTKIFIATNKVFRPVLATDLVRLVDHESSMIRISNLNRTVRYDLGIINMNHIKAFVPLAVSHDTTFLSAWQPFVNDTSGNPVSLVGFDQLNGLQVAAYTPDTTPPTLLYWDADIDTGEIELVFSETVYMIFFNFSRVVFTNGPNCSFADIAADPVATANCTTVRLDNPINTPQNNTDKVGFKFSAQQFNVIKAIPELLSAPRNAYLVLEHRVVVDTSAAQNLYQGIGVATYENPLQARIFSGDHTSPRLLSFMLNMDARTMLLHFSETVKLSTMDLTQLSLQSDKTRTVATEVFTFSPSLVDVLTNRDADSILIGFPARTFSLLKEFAHLAKSVDRTFVTVSRSFIQDRERNVPNSIEEIDASFALQARGFTPDTSAPSLISWEIDLTQDLLRLTFSKPLDIDSITPSELKFTSDAFYLPSTEEYQLAFDSYVASVDLNDVEIQLSLRDANNIRGLRDLCASADTCYLSFLEAFADDVATFNASVTSSSVFVSETGSGSVTSNSTDGTVFQRAIVPVSSDAPILYTGDTVLPVLLNVSLDMNLQQMELVFSESMDARSFNASLLTLFKDFTESEFDPETNITSYTTGYASVVLSKYAVSDAVYAEKFHLQLTRHDFIRIQLQSPLATSIDTVNITLEGNQGAVVTDVAGNPLALSSDQVTGSEGMLPFQYVPDSTSPVLLAIYLESTTTESTFPLSSSNQRLNLTLYFSEAVRVDTLQQEAFLFISSAGATVSLAQATLLTTDTLSNFILLDVSPLASDLAQFGIAESQATTHIYVSSGGAVSDASTAANAIAPMDSSTALRDGVSVTGFRLDMNAGVLMLELAFPIEIATVSVGYITLMSTEEGAGLDAQHTLTGYTSFEVDPTGPFVLIELTQTDYVQLRIAFTIASKDSVELRLGDSALRDGNGKKLAGTVTVPCTHFTTDSSQLRVDTFILDLTVGTLEVVFNKEAETATLFSTVLDEIISLQAEPELLANETSSVPRIELYNITIIDRPDLFGYLAPNATSLLLNLNNLSPVPDNLTEGTAHTITAREQILLDYPLGGSASTTYLTVRKGLIYDLARPRNPLQGISSLNALGSGTIISDSAPPVLQNFDLDLTLRTLTLFFSESVDMLTVQPQMFQFLEDPLNEDSVVFTPKSSSLVVSVSPSRMVVIELSQSDIDMVMQTTPELILPPAAVPGAMTPSSLHIAMAKGAVYDLATPANPAEPVLFRYGLPMRYYTPDTSPPELLWFNFSIQSGEVVMFYNEMIHCSAVRPSRMVIQHQAFEGTGRLFHQLSNRSVPSCSPLYDETSLYVHFTLDVDDIAIIKTIPELAKTVDRMFLRLLSGAVRDVAGNANEEIHDGFAMAPTAYEPDTVPPRLLAFLVNAQHQFSLFFSEPVDPATLVVREIWLQNNRYNSTRAYPLIKASMFRVNEAQTKLDFNFKDDYYRISEDSPILNFQDVTYLRASVDTVIDMSGNKLEEIPRTNALHMGPAVISWDLDMNTGLAEFTYAEAVNTSLFAPNVFVLQDEPDVNAQTLALTTAENFQARAENGVAKVYSILSAKDINNLKNSGLAGSGSNIYLTVPYGVSTSTNPGDLIPYLTTVETRVSHAVPVRRYIRDSLPPICSSFDLNLNEGFLALNFDEPTNPHTTKLNELVLFSSVSGNFVALSDVDFAVLGSSISSNNNNSSSGSALLLTNVVGLVNDTQLRVNLSVTDLSRIKLAVGPDNVPLDLLVIGAGAIEDLLGNKIVGNDADSPIPLSRFTVDTTPPEIVSWVLDLSNFEISVVFDELVDAAAISPLQFTLLSSASANASVAEHSLQLTNFSVIEEGNDRGVVVTVSSLSTGIDSMTMATEVIIMLDIYRVDSLALQEMPELLLNPSQLYIAAASVPDLFGNRNAAVLANDADADIALIDELIPSNVDLELEAFDFESDGAAGTVDITVYFSRYVSFANFTCADLKLRSEPSETASGQVALSHADCALDPGLVGAAAVNNRSSGYAVRFTVDETLFSAGATTIGDAEDSTWMNVPEVGRTVAMLTLLGLGGGGGSGGYEGYEGYGGYPLRYIHPHDSLKVGPRLVHFSFDANTGRLVLVFNKPLDFSQTFNISTIGFYSSLSGDRYYLRAPDTTGGNSVAVQLQPYNAFAGGAGNSSVAYLDLDNADLTAVKLLEISKEQLFILITEDMGMLDSLGRRMDAVGLWGPERLPVSYFEADSGNPELLSISLDFSNELLILEFNEPIRVSNFRVTNLRLQASAVLADSNNYYDLTGGTLTLASSTLTIELSLEDAAALKLQPGLAKNGTGGGDAFLSFPYDTAYDFAGNPLPAISPSAARAVDAIINDTVRPTLDGFIFDRSQPEAAYVTLLFSEPVDVVTTASLGDTLIVGASDPVSVTGLNFTGITVQSRFASRDGVSHRLTGGTVVRTVLNQVTIALLPEDLLAMQLTFGLIRSKQSTYFAILEGIVTDLAGNTLIAYLDGAALPCTTYIKDTTPPYIVTSTLDLNSATVEFLASEPIILGTVDASALTIQLRDPSGPNSHYTLSSLSYPSDPDSLSRTVVINLAQSDQDQLKSRSPLGTSRFYTWLTFFPSLMEDTSQNAIARVTRASPLQVTSFLQDVTRPTVLHYRLDMNAQTLDLRFSEAVQPASLDLNQLLIQTVPTRRFGSYIVLNGSLVTLGTGAASGQLTLSIDDDTMAFMKFSGIGLDLLSSYLSWSDVFVSDSSGNYLAPFWDASVYGYTPRTPDVLQVDTTGPVLQRWYLNHHTTSSSNRISVLLFFDEPVELLDATSIKLYYSTLGAGGGIAQFEDWYPLTHSDTSQQQRVSVTYNNFNREVTIELVDYCKVNVTSGQGCTSSTSSTVASGASRATQTLFAFLSRPTLRTDSTSRHRYFLSILPRAVQDKARSPIPNPVQQIVARKAIREDQPDCSTCADGQFVSTRCTESSDRICSDCTSCKYGTYIRVACQPYQDTSCAACGSCGYGRFIAQPCASGGYSDIRCAPCSTCGPMQFASRTCELGVDTICETCEVCEFQEMGDGKGTAAQKACERDKRYFAWQEANCCKDRSGRKVACDGLDRSRMREIAVDGRHHWTFPDTSPKIDAAADPLIRFPNKY